MIRNFVSKPFLLRKSLLLSAMALSFSFANHVDAQNLIFTFSDDGSGGTRVVASGGTATAVGNSDNPLIGVRTTGDGGDTGFGFSDDAFPFATFSGLGTVGMSDPMTLISGGGLASAEITQGLFVNTVFTPLWLANSASAGATLSAIGAPDPVGTLSIPYSVFASLDGTTIVNSEDGWEFRFGTVAAEAPGVVRISSIRKFERTVVGKKSRPQTVRITNIGQSDINSISANMNERAAGEFDATTPATTLAAGKSTSMKVTFEPKRHGTRRATMTVSSSVGNQVLAVTGRAVAPKSGYQVPRPASKR